MRLKKIYEELVLIRKELQAIRGRLESMKCVAKDLRESSSRLGTNSLSV